MLDGFVFHHELHLVCFRGFEIAFRHRKYEGSLLDCEVRPAVEAWLMSLVDRCKVDCQGEGIRPLLRQGHGIRRIVVHGFEFLGQYVGEQIDAFARGILLSACFQSDLLVLTQNTRKCEKLDGLPPETGMILFPDLSSETPKISRSHVHGFATAIALPGNQGISFGIFIVIRQGEQGGGSRFGTVEDGQVSQWANHCPYEIVQVAFVWVVSKEYDFALQAFGSRYRMYYGRFSAPAAPADFHGQHVGNLGLGVGGGRSHWSRQHQQGATAFLYQLLEITHFFIVEITGRNVSENDQIVLEDVLLLRRKRSQVFWRGAG